MITFSFNKNASGILFKKYTVFWYDAEGLQNWKFATEICARDFLNNHLLAKVKFLTIQ